MVGDNKTVTMNFAKREKSQTTMEDKTQGCSHSLEQGDEVLRGQH